MTTPFSVRRQDLEAARALGAELGVGSAVAQVLLQRGFAEAERARGFLEPRLALLRRPDAMADFEKALTRIGRAIRERAKVAVFADYDVDGMTSASIVTLALRHGGLDPALLVADRFAGGYGLGAHAYDRIIELRPSLVIACDCGSTNHETIARLQAEGVDVIVIDHHHVPAEPLPAFAFINPHRPECGFGFKGLASAGLALYVATGLRPYLPAGWDPRELLDLAALGTIADVAELTDENRILARVGLERMGRGEVRPGLRALAEAARLVLGDGLGASDVGYRLAPRINAPGRLGHAELALELLLEADADRARERAALLEQYNQQRKDIERTMSDEAILLAEKQHASRLPGLVVWSERWHRGVVGIVAARLVDRFNLPALVFAVDDDLAHGSARAPARFNVHAALSECAALFERFGGHSAAAGMVVRRGRLDELVQTFAAAIERALQATPAPAAVGVMADVVIGPGAHPLPSWSDLQRLEPVGQGNPAPHFLIEQAQLRRADVVGARHLKLELEFGGDRVAVFGLGMGALSRTLAERARVSCVGTLRPDRWRGRGAIEMDLKLLV